MKNLLNGLYKIDIEFGFLFLYNDKKYLKMRCSLWIFSLVVQVLQIFGPLHVGSLYSGSF